MSQRKRLSKRMTSSQRKQVRAKTVAGRNIEAGQVLMPRAPAAGKIRSRNVAGRKIKAGQVLMPRAPARKR